MKTGITLSRFEPSLRSRSAEAQQPKKVPRIGYLISGRPIMMPRAEGIRGALLTSAT